MDIAGAKALKERLGSKGTDEAPPRSVDVPEDAAPVYHWTSKVPREADPLEADDDSGPGLASLFSRLSPSLR